MTKATRTKLEMKGVLSPITPKRNLTPEETMELSEMIRMVNARKFEAAQIKGNTALVPDGQKVAEQSAAIAALLDNAKNLWVSQTLLKCGYAPDTRCSLNLGTGEIIVTP